MESFPQNKKKVLLIIFITMAVFVSGGIFFTSQKNNKPQGAKNSPYVRISPAAKTNAVGLRLLPVSQIIRSQQPFEVQVVIDNKETPLSAVTLKMIYDKDMIFVQEAAIDEFFTNPIVFENTIDNKLGLLMLSLGSTTPSSRSGVLVRIKGITNYQATGETDMVISPESKVIPAGSTSSVLGSAGQASLKIIL